jgi:hypothetical protein
MYGYHVELEDGTTYTGCAPVGRRGACADRYFHLENGRMIDADNFTMDLVIPWYPGGEWWPFAFERLSATTFRGECDSLVDPGKCDHTFLRITITWMNDYFSEHDMYCLVECEQP